MGKQDSEKQDSKLLEESSSLSFIYQEYFVDFLGGLLPGTLFFAIGLYLFLPSFLLLVNVVDNEVPTSLLQLIHYVFQTIKETPSMLWIAISVIYLCLSYVIGHIFYRQDPKYPNLKSLKLLMKKEREKLGEKECYEQDFKNEFGCKSEDECEFPYHYFRSYLSHRGLTHLTPLAVWCEKSQFRTKNYINILKMRIRFYHPSRCGTIIRNEAHIRLATSIWYVGKIIKKIGYATFLIWLGTLIVLLMNPIIGSNGDIYSVINSNNVIALFTIITGGYLGYYMQANVEDFLHYQRQREVIHVLETAWIAFSAQPDLLNPPFLDWNSKAIIDN